LAVFHCIKLGKKLSEILKTADKAAVFQILIMKLLKRIYEVSVSELS